ncbi:hypothetical protein KBC79_05650, partial [Candidatus Woesebacteria bacterium]|nr:hypothetical protein [Candidatus Woesebacteria bacterium]
MQGSSSNTFATGETPLLPPKQPIPLIKKVQSLTPVKAIVMLAVLVLGVVSLPLALRSASQPTRTTSRADDGQVAGLGQNEYY